MASLWKDILLPVAVAGAIAAQTVGVEASRASRLHAWFPGALRDTLVTADSVIKAPADTTFLEDEEEDFFFGEEENAPAMDPRDTLIKPDSLRYTNPFLYEWYVATKDSYIHRKVVDSLKAEGDSLLWPRIDSIFVADSTLQAKIAWEKKWAGMTNAERKRWTYENVQLPAIRRRQDSILRRKDSIKHVKDSIRQSTPRVLETSFLPDSLQFKRLVTWKHNRMNNAMEVFEWDTTANYHFYDYRFMREDVGASWLGMPGSAVQSYNWFLRDKDESASFYKTLETWTYTPDNLPQFNTKTPYTELEYSGNLLTSSTLASDNFRVFTTQNIFPSLNVAAEMSRNGGAGNLKNEKTDNRNYFVAGNYLGKKYLAHGGFIYNHGTRVENGGVQDNTWIRDTLVDVREIDVNFASASSRHKKTTFFYDQSFRIPFDFIEALRHRGDSTWVKADTVNTNITTGFIGTSSEYSVYTRKYVDNIDATLLEFYNGEMNINPSKSADSLRMMRLENRIFVRLQPWREDALLSKVEGGVGNRIRSYYLQSPDEFLYKSSNHRRNSFYAYAGAEGRLSRYFDWNASALLNFAGTEAGDFYVKGNAKFSLYPFRRHPESPISLTATGETRLQEPDFYEQNFYTNHYKWSNEFSKVSTTRLQAVLDIPRWDLKAHVSYGLLSGNVYYDTLGVARQNTSPMSVLAAGLTKNIAFGPVHLDNSALLQISSNQEVLPLPLLALNLRWYLQFNVVDPKTLQMQIGANMRYTTEWYAPAYNPVAGVFFNQQDEKYGNCPVFDVFVNMQWKKCCLFVKMENAGRGWPKTNRDYFTAHHYIQAPAMIKVGVSWPFYPPSGQRKTMSERTSSGLGGAGGGSSSSSGNSRRITR